jgi:hypothetical protein
MSRHFNGGGDADSADSRSDDKGPEAEGMAIGKIWNRWYLFGAAERASMIYVWDITDPVEPAFLSVTAVHDCDDPPETRKALLKDPEALEFINRLASPTGYDTLIASGAETGTLTTFRVVRAPQRYMCDAPPVCGPGCEPIVHVTSSSRRRLRSKKCPASCQAI